MGLKQETASYPEGLSDAQIEALKLILTGVGGMAVGFAGYAMINSMEFSNTGEQPGPVDEPALITPIEGSEFQSTPEPRGDPEAHFREVSVEECPGGTHDEWKAITDSLMAGGYTEQEAYAAAILCSIGPFNQPNSENASDARQQFSDNRPGPRDQRAQVRTERLVYQSRPIPR